MITFDETLGVVEQTLAEHEALLRNIRPVIVNRDLTGRVRLILLESVRSFPEIQPDLDRLASSLSERLTPHSYPPASCILYETDLELAKDGLPEFPLGDLQGVTLIDRMANEGRWANISPPSSGAERIVFFSIKGGVGRSTAIAASAWALAQSGKRVLVLDLDLESPGLSSALLPDERRPAYGITDWLVEDLVDNGAAILDDILATSELSHDGEIHVVPAHGRDPGGDYISKLGRVWMPTQDENGNREGWSQRLRRLIKTLEERIHPDTILIDSRSGIDEIASSCVTDLGASLALLFAIEGEQTWTGYRILFDYWRRAGVVRDIRERLQLVGAMIPELGGIDYLQTLNEHGWDLFSEMLYDEVPPGSFDETFWNFDAISQDAPHYPWAIKWHRGFSALPSLHDRFLNVDPIEIRSIFGPLLNGISVGGLSTDSGNG